MSDTIPSPPDTGTHHDPPEEMFKDDAEKFAFLVGQMFRPLDQRVTQALDAIMVLITRVERVELRLEDLEESHRHLRRRVEQLEKAAAE